MSRRPLREKQRLFWRLISEGRSRLAAARELGLSHHTGQRWFRQGGGVASSHVHAKSERPVPVICRTRRDFRRR